MNNLRIVFLTQYFPPEMGAPQSRLYETALLLKNLGWDIRIVSALPNYPTGKVFSGYRGKLFVKEIINGLTVSRYWLYPSNSKRILPRVISMFSFSFSILFAFFELFRFRPTFIFVESPPLLLGLNGYIFKLLLRSKLVLNISDLWPLSAVELGVLNNQGLAYRFLSSIESFLYRNSDACTGQSQEIVDYISDHGSKRVLLFRNGVDVSRFKYFSEPCYNRRLRIVYAGLLGVAQGILKYCQELDFSSCNMEFHIYGQGQERELIESFLLKSKKSGIYLHEPVDRDAIPKVLSDYDLSFIPLIAPIFGAVPSKIYESMAAGLPILFAGGGEGARIISTYNLGWTCRPSDMTALQKQLFEISQLGILELGEIRKNCLNSALSHFNREIQVYNLNKFLLEL